MINRDMVELNCYLERLFGMEEFLSDTLKVSSPSYKDFLNSMVEKLKGLEEELVRSFREGKKGIFKEIEDSFKRIYMLASLIPSKPEIPQELWTFISYYLGKGQREGIVILYQENGEIGIAEELGMDLIILRLPFFEYKSPYMWALLAHDMAHIVDRRKRISERISSKSSELLADLMALLMMGPAYPYALMLRYLLSDPYLCIEGHSTLGFREMGDILKDLRIYFARENGITQSCIELLLSEQPSVDLDKDLVEPLIEVMGKESIPIYTSEDSNISKFVLFPRLEKGELISSYRDPKIEPIVRSMLGNIRYREGPNIYDIVKMLEEKPANPSQILNAGWEKVCKELMAEADLEDIPGFLDSFRGRITGIREILRRSIETASIHRLFMPCGGEE